MRRFAPLLLLAGIALSLSACSSYFGSEGSAASSSSLSSSDDIVLNQVSYEGVIQKLDATIYTEGTHRLNMDDGTFLLLRSDVVGLDDYVGEHVRVIGSVRQTVDGSARIMQVMRAEVLLGGSVIDSGSTLTSSSEMSSSSSSSSSEVSSSSSSSVKSSKALSASSISRLSSSSVLSSSSKPIVSSSLSSAPVKVSSSSSSSLSSSANSAAFSSIASAMAKAGTDPSRWTQQYCSPSIGFCILVHKNWYYKSYGASTSFLWHVELSSSEMNALGDGPISVNFVSGTIPSDAADSMVIEKDGKVTGYRSWTEVRHFEITGPSSLKPAITFITTHLSMYVPPPR